MLSEARQSTRSPTSSLQTDSTRPGPYSARSERQTRRSSITEENDNEYEQATNDRTDEQTDGATTPPRREDQYISALQHRFPSRPKSDYAYTKPAVPPAPPPPSSGSRPAASPSTSSTSRSTPRQTNGANATRTDDDRPFQKPALRRVSPDEQNTYARRTTTNEPTPASTGGGTRRTAPSNARVSARDIDETAAQTTFTPQTRLGRNGESVFEKVDTHGGPISYLGTGTFSQFEQCLRECLAREHRHTGIESHLIRHDLPARSTARVSLLDDYSYDPVVSSHHHVSHSFGTHDYPDIHRRSAALLSLDDIRHVNNALTKSGISVFPYHEHHHHHHQQHYHHEQPHHYQQQHQPHDVVSSWFGDTHSPYHGGRRIIGEIVSACRIVDDDPGRSSSPTSAIQHVWNAAQHYQPFGHSGGYASPAVRGVASHLFNPTHQTPYDPVHSVASHLFPGHPQQQPPPPSYGSPYPYPPPAPPPPPPIHSYYAH